MAPQLAGDGGRGVRRERLAEPRVVPPTGFDQRKVGHLDQLFERLAAVAVAQGQAPGQREMLEDQAVPLA
jgi:hypothetical protein